MNRKERRDAARRRESALDPVTIVASLVGAMGAFTQRERNEQRTRPGNMIWGTLSAAIGVCPGYDDFLVWLDFQNEPAMAVPMTAEAVEDFSRNILPLIERHKELNAKLNREYDSSNIEWLLSTCNRVREQGYPEDMSELFGSQQDWEELPSYQPSYDAYHAVTAALAEFLGRNNAVPDLV